MNVDHLKRIQEAFTRQADTFDAYAERADVRVEERFCNALENSAGLVLDLACGPGVVTAAVARISTAVIGFDATPAMLDKAHRRCSELGLGNVSFQQGDASLLPFDDGQFDAVVTRLAIHHFQHPAVALAEVFRVLRPGGTLVIADVVVSEDPAEGALQNAIENLRDPSHVRILSLTEFDALVRDAGFNVAARSIWDKEREFEEWMGIANDAQRAQALGVVARALAAAGYSAGMGLAIDDDRVVFYHRWMLLTATRPR